MLEITCPALRNPADGTASFSNEFNNGSVAMFDCHHGYRLNGADSLMCNIMNMTAAWNGTEPSCISKYEVMNI